MVKNKNKYLLFISLLSLAACRDPQVAPESAYDARLSGGENTVFDESVGAFGARFSTLSSYEDYLHSLGDAHFNSVFVSAPAPINPGLGPLFNNVSCVSCHANDGRGKPPLAGQEMESMLIRMSVPGSDDFGGPMPAKGFGGQLQTLAIAGAMPEAKVDVQYVENLKQFLDGEKYSQWKPSYRFYNSYVEMPANYMYSPRVAPPVFGLGLLEAISESSILSKADEFDADGDGISGRPNYVWDFKENKLAIGRFGWKANNPNLLQQTAGAYNQDMGITSFMFNQESSFGQSQYIPNNDKSEVADSVVHAVAFYMQSLSVPARRRVNDPQVLRGEQLFNEAMCGKCHVSTYKTATNILFPSVSNQLIHPYTDLLLHDLGDDLGDGRPDYKATGNEWRTAPLWGLGLTKVVNGHNNFLHDGRARNIVEAIMWHGGEAAKSRGIVEKMNKADRTALLSFLNSL